MSLELTNKSGTLVPSEEVTSLMAFAIDYMELHPECELNLTFVDEIEMEALHIKWMDETGTTDVLSFPMDEMKPNSAANGPGVVGDIVLCPT